MFYTQDGNLFQVIATAIHVFKKDNDMEVCFVYVLSIHANQNTHVALNTKFTCIVYTAWIQQLGSRFRTWPINNLFIYTCTWMTSAADIKDSWPCYLLVLIIQWTLL